MKKAFITLIALLLPLVASAQTKRTIHVATAGTLSNYISENEKYQIEELTLTGELNGTDIRLIRDMSGINFERLGVGDYSTITTSGILKVLDITNAKIVAGGGYYYAWTKKSWEIEYEYGTRDNSISDYMFYGCKLQCIKNPNSVTSIGEYAFVCKQLTSVNIPSSVTSIGDNAFNGQSGLTSITIPNSVTNIGDCAFIGCSSLSTIASEIENPFEISKSVFDSDIYHTAELIIPEGTLAAYQSTSSWNLFFKLGGDIGDVFNDDGIIYKIGENNTVSVSGPSDFSGDIVIPNQVCFNGVVYLVTSIEESAFYHWPYDESTKSVTIPSSITNIGSDAFKERMGLTAVYISDLEAWCKIQFNGDGSNPLESAHHLYLNGTEIIDLVIPNSVTTIKDRAFWSCSSLTSLTIPNSVTSIGDDAFHSCSGLTSVTIPNSVTSIGGHSFIGCSGLTSITIPNSVTSIGEGAFYGCSGLTSINVENGNTMYDSRNNCNAIIEKLSNTLIVGCKNSTIPNSVTSIGGHAFFGCSGLTSITIPNSVTSIETAAFMSCGLTSVIIPPSVSSIRYYAFEACPLTDFYCLAEKVPSTPESFIDWDDLHHITLYVPAKSIELYKTANLWKDFKYIREIIAGDMNLNNVVDNNDLNALVDFVMGKDVQGFYKCLADLNGDDKVNAADVVKLITILNIQEGLSTDWQFNYNSSQVVSSLNCTLNNDGDKAIQLTKCELYCNQILAGSANFKVTLGTGGNKSCTFNDLSSFSTKTGFSVVWYYTYNGESYTYRCDLTE